MTKVEYIWVDGSLPSASLRSKTKILNQDEINIDELPLWSFDGSSTNQADGDKSDCVLKPIRWYNNPLEGNNSILVLCEVLNVDGTPHESNNRHKLEKLFEKHSLQDPWVGFEQEYTLFKNDRPFGWPEEGEPEPQGDYYCGRNSGEFIARRHMDVCMSAGITISGINSEVMLGQWEYQIGVESILKASDDLWVARWLMEKIASKNNIQVSLDPKPVEGDWNGAGCHTNFSTKAMRENDGDLVIHRAIKSLQKNHEDHIKYYGDGNDKRLTGIHETCNIDEFKWGISDRTASIRIPWQVAQDGKGYFEDRRPSANCDPYLVSVKLLETICDEN